MKCSFIVSTGRTGTQSLAKVLEQIDGRSIAAYHEPSPSRIFRVVSTLRAAGILSDGFALTCIKAFRDDRVYDGEHSVYVESNNFLFGLCDLLSDSFEDARILHIVRDPRTYVESHLRHGVFRGVKGLVSRFFPYWLIKPRHLGIKSTKPWLCMSQHQRLFWFWALVNRVISNSCSGLDGKYRVVRYEDLFSDKDLFIDVLLWLGLSQEKIEQASSFISKRYNVGVQPYEEVTLGDSKLLKDICGDQAEYFGYQL